MSLNKNFPPYRTNPEFRNKWEKTGRIIFIIVLGNSGFSEDIWKNEFCFEEVAETWSTECGCNSEKHSRKRSIQKKIRGETI